MLTFGVACKKTKQNKKGYSIMFLMFFQPNFIRKITRPLCDPKTPFISFICYLAMCKCLVLLRQNSFLFLNGLCMQERLPCKGLFLKKKIAKPLRFRKVIFILIFLIMSIIPLKTKNQIYFIFLKLCIAKGWTSKHIKQVLASYTRLCAQNPNFLQSTLSDARRRICNI